MESCVSQDSDVAGLPLAAIAVPTTIIPTTVIPTTTVPMVLKSVLMPIPIPVHYDRRRASTQIDVDGESGLIAADIRIGGYRAHTQQNDHRTNYVNSTQEGCFCTGFHCLIFLISSCFRLVSDLADEAIGGKFRDLGGVYTTSLWDCYRLH